MSEILQAIEFHLGRKLNGSGWNYYSLLGVQSTATSDEIKVALKAAAAAWNASDRKANPARAQQVAQLLREAQATLLDASKRSTYDEELRREGADTFFDRNPSAAFDPSQLVPQDFVAPWPGPEARYASLVAVLDPPSRPARTLEIGSAGSLAMPPSLPAFQASSSGNVVSQASQTAGATTSSAAARIQALKRKRQRNQFITVSVILVSAIGFLSYAAVQFVASQKRLAKQDTPQNVAPAELQREFAEGMKENAAKNSDTPPAASDLPSLPTGEASETAADAKPEMPADDMPSPFDIKPMELPSELSNPGVMTEKPPAEMPVAPASPTVTSMANENWSAKMKEARESLSKPDFAAFSKAMEATIQMPMTAEMEAKQKRLDQLGQLYQMAVEAMREARSKTRGTEEISVGKNLVTIVEVNDETIVVRVAGKNERYNWNQLPLGLALAMSDLTLSDREPTDLAARAVYLSLAPNKTALYDKKIKEYFEKSLGKGEIRADLPQAFTDTYE